MGVEPANVLDGPDIGSTGAEVEERGPLGRRNLTVSRNANDNSHVSAQLAA